MPEPELLLKTLKESPVVKRKGYDYFVHPITDGIPQIEPELLKEVVREIVERIEHDYDKIIAIEAMGLPIGTALALETNKPLVVIRKRQYGLEGEVAVEQVTGYSRSELYINGINKNDRVLVVDDVMSTGGTLSAVIKALRSIGARICDTIIVIEKGYKKPEIERALDIEIKTIVKVDVVDGRVVIL